jgi:hypothetical protein
MKIFNIKTTNNTRGFFDYDRSNQLPATASARRAPAAAPSVPAMLRLFLRSH